MSTTILLSLATFLITSAAQQVGTLTTETHPSLSWQKCTVAGGCATQAGKIVLDANWRWLHSTADTTNCYNGNTWNAALCPDSATCTTNCALDGADYAGTYGITTSGNALTLKFVTTGANKNVGSRVYLMASDTAYQNFAALNAEFTMDVDVSRLPCGLNGAVYFVEMDLDGGMAKYPTNKAGAKYGTGYCDSQCPRDLKFVGGSANNVGWTGTSTNSGTGNFGSCCNEMDLWEANSISTAYTPHPCTPKGLYKCTGQECGVPDRQGGVCDPDGCDFNSYRMGDTSFYGPGKTVDTTKKFTVVTQFITSDGTSSGTLVEIRRVYVQGGVVINNSKVNIPGMAAYDSITETYCTDQKSAFGDVNGFAAHGGLAVMGQSLARSAVLVLSIWDDYAVNMLWLDSIYPTTASASTPGAARGSCPITSGIPAELEVVSPDATVTYSNIRFGELGSTVPGVVKPVSSSVGSVTTTSKATTSTTSTKSTTSTSKTSTSSTKATSKTTSTTSSKVTSTTLKTTSTTSSVSITSAPSTTSSLATTTSTTATGGATQAAWGQCGGKLWTGPTLCPPPTTCQFANEWFSQCLR